ncbi:hypothetical protein LCGC14_1645400 [marine sediment metagenome]|uniref:Uncharacterized protein n=1 Tax=marine sediment metagenome TaxID=412755 RepID=A0A0F9KY86_9ZZZZ
MPSHDIKEDHSVCGHKWITYKYPHTRHQCRHDRDHIVEVPGTKHVCRCGDEVS